MASNLNAAEVALLELLALSVHEPLALTTDEPSGPAAVAGVTVRALFTPEVTSEHEVEKATGVLNQPAPFGTLVMFTVVDGLVASKF